jgi:copper homeostasis protein
MAIFLEVIVTSVAEAVEAERGEADRLELVRALEQGGLTPPVSLVEEVVASVRVPVRVMVRETDCMFVGDLSEKVRLQRAIDQFMRYPIDGVVLGFLRDGQIDERTLTELLPEKLQCRVTFHRAFDELKNPAAAIEVLKRYPQIDRVLTRAGEGSWQDRRANLEEWQTLAGPGIQMLFAIGRDTSHLSELHQSERLYEVHVGRAARVPHVNSGVVRAEYVAALKRNAPVHS